MQYIAVVYEL